jgi:hypothetical protein
MQTCRQKEENVKLGAWHLCKSAKFEKVKMCRMGIDAFTFRTKRISRKWLGGRASLGEPCHLKESLKKIYIISGRFTHLGMEKRTVALVTFGVKLANFIATLGCCRLLWCQCMIESAICP